MATQQPARRKMQPTAQVSIPDKLYFRIGDVARLCSLPAYVLRFWETEFPQLKPNKGGTGQRLYRKRDVEMVLEIKHLLYEEGFTIAGARRLMAENRRVLHAERDRVPAAVSKTQRPSNGVKEASAPARRSASEVLQPPAKPKAAPSSPRLKDIRKEMKELLALLGAEDAASSTMQAPLKRGTKKNHPTDDAPTLF